MKRDWSRVHPSCRPKAKPYCVVQSRKMVYNPDGHVIGYVEANEHDLRFVSDYFATQREAEQEARRLNTIQGIPLYRTNIKGSTVAEVSG